MFRPFFKFCRRCVVQTSRSSRYNSPNPHAEEHRAAMRLEAWAADAVPVAHPSRRPSGPPQGEVGRREETMKIPKGCFALAGVVALTIAASGASAQKAGGV